LVIFEKAEVTKIEKVGFERGRGFILQIFIANEGKNYKVRAGYIPRRQKLIVIKLEEV
jgi:hypothetical protein